MSSTGQLLERPQTHYSQQQEQQQQQQSFPTTATSAIFGTSTFERPIQQHQQHQQHQPLFRATSLVMNGSYFMGPRAPQYIPSPLASPVSPGLTDPLLATYYHNENGQGFTDSANDDRSIQGSILKTSLSQGSISALAADLLQEHHQTELGSAVIQLLDEVEQQLQPHYHHQQQERQGADQQQQYDDDIKVDVTELYENFGQKPIKVEYDESIAGRSGIITVDNTAPLSSSLPSKLPEFAFSNNDLTSLWAPGTETSGLGVSMVVDGSGRRPRTNTFHGHSDASQDKEKFIESLLAPGTVGGLKQPAFPPKQPSPLKAGHVLRADSNRKRLSLITSSVGLAAVAKSKLEKSSIELPTWGLAPLSPPVEVKETGTTSASASPMSARGGAMERQQDPHNNRYMNGASATLMTPTTPLTNREARILAGHEGLLRMSPDKQRVQRGLSTSTTSSSVNSLIGSPASPTLDSATIGGGDDTETIKDLQGTARRMSIRSQNSRKTNLTQFEGGIYGAVPERGQLKDIPIEKLVFPDQSIRPVPLKAYRIRKMTLKERNQAYTQACEEFRLARTGLDVWTLRCMMQERPAIMKGKEQ
ncbi:hypothetical protein BGZ65_005808 [Modicella reniformis]|uniref:Uncharacterized protein n=1 Tax=Modicella reniformis TaxID=1440133 RepID=A0A9P6ING6_9FUNG|nr:hypothetical protein BGZ65_005808 [Modicella reniformis]